MKGYNDVIRAGMLVENEWEPHRVNGRLPGQDHEGVLT